MKLFATQKLAIGYPEPANAENPDGPKLVVTYAEGEEVPNDGRIDNLVGLIDQKYLRVEAEPGDPELVTYGEGDIGHVNLGGGS
jgi:hypothetical protein